MSFELVRYEVYQYRLRRFLGIMKRRPGTSPSRSSASRTGADRASTARAKAAHARTNRAFAVEEGHSRGVSRQSSPSPSKSLRGRRKQASEKPTPATASSSGPIKSHSAYSSGVVPTTSRDPGKQRSNVRVLPRGVHPNDLNSGVESTPKRMKVSVRNTGTSPASTLTTVSLKSSSSTSMSSKSRSMKSSGARSTTASTAIRKLALDQQDENRNLNIFVAKLYSDDDLFDLYCNKANPSIEEKDDFVNAAFKHKLHDVLSFHTPSENKSAYVKLCAELDVYCDAEKVKTESKTKAAIKELVLPYYEQLR